MADPFTIAAVLAAANSGANLLGLNSQDVRNQNTAQPTGGNTGNFSPVISANQPQQSPVQQPPDMFAQLIEAAAQNTAPDNSQVLAQKPPQLQANADGDKDGQQEQASIGEVLAAVPEAAANIAQLLGLNQQNVNSQRAAPIAGGNAGGPVGIFAQTPQNLNIGQLLAALPGIR